MKILSWITRDEKSFINRTNEIDAIRNSKQTKIERMRNNRSSKKSEHFRMNLLHFFYVGSLVCSDLSNLCYCDARAIKNSRLSAIANIVQSVSLFTQYQHNVTTKRNIVEKSLVVEMVELRLCSIFAQFHL